MKIYPILFFAAIFATSCSKNDRFTIASPHTIRIAPEIRTRVTGSSFETTDTIGVTIRRADGTRYLDNRFFTFDGTNFSSAGIAWYPETDEATTVTAYYPYATAGEPETFTVATDQRGDGYRLSDLLGAVRTEVKPTLSPVEMLFYHLLSKITVALEVADGRSIGRVLIGGFVPTAHIALEPDSESFVATPASDVPAREITAREVTADATYDIILPPQSTTLAVAVESATGRTTKSIPNVTLLQGRSYTLRMKITADGEMQEIRFSGSVHPWESGTVIEQDPFDDDNVILEDPRYPDGGKPGAGLEYEGVRYLTCIIGGREWMAENLYCRPQGYVYLHDYWYPYDDESRIAALGVLYSYPMALAGAKPVLNDAATIRGICPEGWRLPMLDELGELAQLAGRKFFTESGYYYSNPEKQLFSELRNYLISSTHPQEGRVGYLRIPNHGQEAADGYMELCTLPVGNVASSVRCVKEEPAEQ